MLHTCPNAAGFAASTPFLRGLLDKWHIKPLGFAREEYKSVVSQFTDKAYNKANREATEAWLNGWMGQIVHDVAAARGLEASDVCKALNASPLSADEAAAAGLITAPGHRSAAMRTLLHSATSSADPASLMHGGQVAEPSGNAAAELNRLKATELLKVEAMQNAVIAVNPGKSAQTPERDSAAQASDKTTRDTVLHSAAEQQDSARVPAVSNLHSSAAQFADMTEQTSVASSPLEQRVEQSRLRGHNAKHGGRTQLQRIQAHKKPLDSALVIHVTPDKLQINCCLALPIDKYIQVNTHSCTPAALSIMHVWLGMSVCCLPHHAELDPHCHYCCTYILPHHCALTQALNLWWPCFDSNAVNSAMLCLCRSMRRKMAKGSKA